MASRAFPPSFNTAKADSAAKECGATAIPCMPHLACIRLLFTVYIVISNPEADVQYLRWNQLRVLLVQHLQKDRSMHHRSQLQPWVYQQNR